MKDKKDLDVTQKLNKYLLDLGTPIFLQAKMTKNLALHPIVVGQKAIAAVTSYSKSEFPLVGANLGEILKVLTIDKVVLTSM